MLRDLILASFSVPNADPGVCQALGGRSLEKKKELLLDWLRGFSALKTRLRFDIVESDDGSEVMLNVLAPYSGLVVIRLLEATAFSKTVPWDAIIAQTLSGEGASQKRDLAIMMVCDDLKDEKSAYIEELRRAASKRASQCLVMEPSWSAALLVEQMKPLFMPSRAAGNGAAYFERKAGANAVTISRTQSRLQLMLGSVAELPRSFSERWLQLEQVEFFKGDILLCTTFPPPFVHSWSVIERFYQNTGATEETIGLVRRKHDWEREVWEAHISEFRRVDILDRGVLEEYFQAPEYYQMLITREELRKQVENWLSLLMSHENYILCLSGEAVDLPFEIRGSEVRIRADRRNKGEPRSGKIDGIVLNDPRLAGIFEREFWSMYRSTEKRFKNKTSIAGWMDEKLSREESSVLSLRENSRYDVFLCYNSSDRATIKEIGYALRDRGLNPWFDEWNLIPGRPWQRVLEAEIERIASAAVFIGEQGLGPWMHLEVDAFLRQFAKRGCPIIPVLLPGSPDKPQVPLFMEGFQSVDFRAPFPSPIDSLIWGITGNKR